MRMVTMGCRVMEPMKSLDPREISAHCQALAVRMTARTRASCLFPWWAPRCEGRHPGLWGGNEWT